MRIYDNAAALAGLAKARKIAIAADALVPRISRNIVDFWAAEGRVGRFKGGDEALREFVLRQLGIMVDRDPKVDLGSVRFEVSFMGGDQLNLRLTMDAPGRGPAVHIKDIG